MRIGYKKFKEIKKWYGSSDFEIGYDNDGLTFRFGYWNKVNIEELSDILDYLTITENIVDDDDDCGTLYNYTISDKRFG